MRERLELIGRLIAERTSDDFLADIALPHALAMQFLALGEAARHLSPEFKAAVPKIEWTKVIGLRHLLAHEYRRIDHYELWVIARNHAPEMLAHLPAPPPPEDVY